MRRLTILTAVLAALLGLAGTAQAVVVSDGGTRLGVALVPGTAGTLGPAGVTADSYSPGCSDPWLSSDLRLPATGALCWRGGNVVHANETFALTWDIATAQRRRYWGATRQEEQQFLQNVAAASGSLGSPYAVTPQYQDPTGRAGNNSVYGGGCIDLGSAGGFTCGYPGVPPAAGNDYPANTCAPSGTTHYYIDLNSIGDFANDHCVTDADIRQELANTSQNALGNHVKAGYTPVITVLLPPGVVVCADGAGHLCSANSTATARFCSYHGMTSGGLAYVVVPWVAFTACDEPDAPPVPSPPSPPALTHDAAVRLISPLSQAHIATLTNPFLNGWVGADGSEVNDNGCVPLGSNLDQVTVGGGSYLLQREFNNAGAMESDPNALGCTPNVVLSPTFVVPSAVNNGDLVQFDGSTTASTLIVPKNNYFWSFGDGTGGTGPSVTHAYAAGGTYTVKLVVLDRGGNLATLSQQILVLGPTGSGGGGGGGGGGGTKPPPRTGLQAKLRLIPEGLTTLLHHGLAMWVTTALPASGIVTLSIPKSTAKKIHLHTTRANYVVIGRGTVRAVPGGLAKFHIRIASATARRLSKLRHVTVTVQLLLTAADRTRTTIDVAGRY